MKTLFITTVMSHSEIMDKPSGLKECPRCGLRNRSGAYQCDFCGWDFRGASDDWMGKVNELQRINKEVESPVLDKRTTSKIEMTIVNPAEVPVKEPKPEMEVPRKLELDEHNDVEPIVAAAVKDEVPFDPEEILAGPDRDGRRGPHLSQRRRCPNQGRGQRGWGGRKR